MDDQQSAVSALRGDLRLNVCHECGFIFNQAFDPQTRLYGHGYENSQACSPSFLEHMDALISQMILERNVRDCHIVEVGCGNGMFLRRLVTDQRAVNRGSGFDPSYHGESSELDGRLRFYTRHYDSECADLPADVVVCRHVIEHLPHPLELLADIRKALIHARAARIFFETPCVEWILSNHVFWDCFYEHCSYFTANSLTTAFEMAGFDVAEVSHVFGGQYLWLEAVLPDKAPVVAKRPDGILELAEAFARGEATSTNRWKEKIGQLKQRGKIAIWGAGAKGVTFANMIDPERSLIDSVIDLNPLKQGHFIPGTGHPIISYTDLPARELSTVILMNPNYREENLALIKKVSPGVQLIDRL